MTRETRADSLELQRDETPAERIDRNFNELLGELRIALPGVQVLFAFLLAVPFANGFASVTGFQKGLYLAVLLCTAIATALLIAPTAYHRIVFRRGRKTAVLAFANRAAIIGLAFLALAMTLAILLITHYLFGAAAAIPISIASGVVFAALWYGLPYASARDAPPPDLRDIN
jgi:hypothetical protein